MPVGMTFLQAGPLPVFGAMTGTGSGSSEDHAAASVDRPAARIVRDVAWTFDGEHACVTSYCGKVTLPDDTPAGFATACGCGDPAAPSSVAEACASSMSPQRYRHR
jgi:hypothetical protein